MRLIGQPVTISFSFHLCSGRGDALHLPRIRDVLRTGSSKAEAPMDEVVIVGAQRTAMGGLQGAFAGVPAPVLGGAKEMATRSAPRALCMAAKSSTGTSAPRKKTSHPSCSRLTRRQ
jgi:hypothetical protein